MKKLAILAATTILAVAGGHAIAQQTGSTEFNNADGNKDGFVSFEEARGVFPTLTQIIFDQADEDKDTKLSPTEFTLLVGLTAGIDANTSSTSSSSGSSDSSSSSSNSSSSSSSSSDSSSSSQASGGASASGGVSGGVSIGG